MGAAFKKAPTMKSLLTGLISLAASSTAPAAFVTTTYVGPVGGSWNLSANWSDGLPNDGLLGNTYHAVLGAPTTVNMLASVGVTQLTVAAGASLLIANDVDPILNGASVLNNGLIQLASTGNSTILQLNSPEVILSGSGALEGLDLNAAVLSINAQRRLTNSAGHTIRGSMSLGSNIMFLTNQGLIEATHPSGLVLDLSGGSASNSNTGVLRAKAGSTLTILGTEIDSSGGLIVGDGGTVDINASSIVGPTFLALNGGQLRLVGGGSSLTNPSIAAGALLRAVNDNDPTLLGTMTNQGIFRLESAGNVTALQLNSPDVLFEGGGSVEGLNQNALIFSIGAVRRLTNRPDHAFRGSMSLGGNNTLLTNEGLIEATEPAGLTLDLTGGAGSNFNLGTLRAGPGSTLTIAGSEFDNTGGTIIADGGTVDISSSTIVNAFLTEEGDGALRLLGGSSVLINPQMDAGATLHVLNDNDPIVAGTVLNEGVIRLESAGNVTALQLNSPDVLFEGGGSVEGLNQNALIFSIGAVRRLTNRPGHAFRGSMSLGGNNTLLTNEGLIEATEPAGLTLDLTGGAGSNFNLGTLRAGPGSTLTIAGSEFDNAGGTILADGGFVDLNSSTIINGLLDSTGAGAIRAAGGVSTLADVTVASGAHLRVLNDSDPIFQQTITNNGLISWESSGSATVMQLNSPVVQLAGTGVLTGTDTTGNIVQSIGAVRRLINGATHAIRGGWSLGASITDITNLGVILADSPAGMVIAPSTDFNNQGVLSVALDGSLTIQPGLFLQSGTFQVASGRTATRNGGPISQSAGGTQIDGTLVISGGFPFSLNGGALRGNGLIQASAVNSAGGTIAPGGDLGQLTLTGTVSFDGASTFEVQVAGRPDSGENDLLACAGSATLAGTIRAIIAGAYSPRPTDEFTVLTAGARVGTFAFVESCEPVEVTYTDTSVVIRFPSSTGVVGDLNGDGLVNGADLGLLLGFWGPCIAGCCPGDFDDDDRVDGADIGVLLANWTP
jgi:hypothetical protein